MKPVAVVISWELAVVKVARSSRGFKGRRRRVVGNLAHLHKRTLFNIDNTIFFLLILGGSCYSGGGGSNRSSELSLACA